LVCTVYGNLIIKFFFGFWLCGNDYVLLGAQDAEIICAQPALRCKTPFRIFFMCYTKSKIAWDILLTFPFVEASGHYPVWCSYLEAYNKTKAIAEGEDFKSKNQDASIVDKYNTSKRSVSLVQKHRESKEKKKQKQNEKEEWEGNHPWKPWDREKDLSAGRQKVSLDPENMSQGLSSRFASGAVQRNFLWAVWRGRSHLGAMPRNFLWAVWRGSFSRSASCVWRELRM
jgi:hypothetical protein